MVDGAPQEPYSGLPSSEGWQLSFADPTVAPPRPRVYPLTAGGADSAELTEEEMAVVFAMTSRRPDTFTEIARQVTAEKAADFHERWVLGYGHASVAEHAVLHMAVEDISRLACDTVEDNRLASYTEKSSRYQVLPRYAYHVPDELPTHSKARRIYVADLRLPSGGLPRFRKAHQNLPSRGDAPPQRRVGWELCSATEACGHRQLSLSPPRSHSYQRRRNGQRSYRRAPHS